MADDALRGSPVDGLDVTIDPAVVEPVYSLVVRLVDRCPSSTWLIVRHAFTIRGAADMRIVIGDVVVLKWVRLYAILDSDTVISFKSRLKTHLFSQAFSHTPIPITNTLPGPSASEVTALWRYTNMFYYYYYCVKLHTLSARSLI